MLRRAVVLPLIALLLAQPLAAQSQEEAPTAWRRYAFAAVGAALLGFVASFQKDPEAEDATTGFCSTRACVMGVSIPLGAGLGYLLGREFDNRASSRFAEGPSLDLSLQSVELEEAPSALVPAGIGRVVALVRDGAALVDDDLVHRRVAEGLAPRSGAVVPGANLLLLGTNDALFGVDLSTASGPVKLSDTGASSIAHIEDRAIAVGEVGRIRRATIGGPGAAPGVTEAASVQLRGVPVSMQVGGGTTALWTLMDSTLVSRDPRTLEELGSLRLPARGTAFRITGRTAVVGMGVAGAALLDLTDPRAPRLLARLEGMRFAYVGTAMDGRAYVAAGAQGVFVFDVTAPDRPRSLGVVRGFGFAADVLVQEGRLFILDRERSELFRTSGS